MKKLASYTESTTPANANDNDFQKNQQLILDDKALFMPNGNWVIGEMAEAPRAEGFEWGFTALPAVTAGGERASYSFFEQVWMPAGAENQDLGKNLSHSFTLMLQQKFLQEVEQSSRFRV